MVNQKRVLVLLSVIIILGVGVGLSIYTLTKPKAIAPLPLLPNAPEYVCAEGMPSSECTQLKLTCGNGVIDYGETCNNCPFDAGCASGLLCGKVNASQGFTCITQPGIWGTGPAR